MLDKPSLIKLIYIIISLNKVSCSCVTTYITRCDTLTDVINNEDSNWRTLIIEANCNNTLCSEEDNKSTLLKPEIFNKTPNIRELFINNQISGIEAGAFGNLKKLASINLLNNKIRKISAGAFSSLKITDLNLTRNGIEAIQEESFSDSEIEVLDLSLNKLTFIPKGIFNKILKLHTLILKNNEIDWINVGAFSELLEILDLSFNKLEDLSAHVFDNLSKLKVLRLKASGIAGIVYVPALSNIEVLDLSNNKLEYIGDGSFKYVKLKELYLQNNKLKDLNWKSFTVPSAIKKIYLHSNYLCFLPGQIGDVFSNLQEVTIGANPWSCGCLSLIQIYVQTNQIKLVNCDEKYFGAGKSPVCFVVDDENECWMNGTYSILSTNMVHINKMREKYIC